MARKIFVWDFLKEVMLLEGACDKYGVQLYDHADIAAHFGMTEVSEIDKVIKDARKVYRDILRDKVKKMREDGKTEDEIKYETGLDAKTADLLIETEKGEKHVQEVNTRAKKAHEDALRRMDEDWLKGIEPKLW